MIEALGGFVATLRSRGLAVSPGEAIDAGHALSCVDLSDRQAVLGVLLATLAKRVEDRDVVTESFDGLFRAPARARKRRRTRKPTSEGAGRAPRPGDASSGAVPRAERDGQRSRPHPSPADARTPADRPDRPYALPNARVLVSRNPRGLEPGDTRRLSRKPFRDRWSSADTIALGDVLRRELARLRLRASRRKRRSRSGVLWVQRTLRANVGHDGIPLRLIRRRRARRHPRLLLLVDVSHSVARAASSFLTLASQLDRAFVSTRILLFVDSIVDATHELPQLTSLAGDPARLDRLVERHPDLNPFARSDHGRVFHQVLAHIPLRRDTVCCILGDARNNFIEPSAWTLEDMRRRLARVLWLVPEPAGEWGRGDSALSAYAPHVDLVAETANVDGLRAALSRAL